MNEGASQRGTSAERTESRSEHRVNEGARRRRLPLPVLLVLMLVGGLCALLALNTASAAQEIQQRKVSDANAGTSDIEQQLLRDLADREAPASLASAAAGLGLVPNPNPAFLRINADGSATVLGVPTPASAPPPPPAPSPTAKARATARPSASTTKPTLSAVPGTVTKPVAKPTSPRAASPTNPTPHPTSTAPGGH